MEITKRELWVSVVIVLVMVGFGFLIASKVHDTTVANNGKYFKALKVDDDPEMFQYAIDTEIGHMVSYGTFKANEPVTDDMIDGEYFAIKRIEEHYVQKTRTVTYTDADGNTKTRTETYWEWDEVDREVFKTETFDYLGKTFDTGFIKFNHYKYKDTVKSGFLSQVRYKFHVIPVEFSGSLYSKAEGKTIKNNKYYHNTTIDELMDLKEKEAGVYVGLFWVSWILLTGGLVWCFIALDNRFLNNKK